MKNVDRIKAAIRTEALVEEISGKNPIGPDPVGRFMGLCPFHDDRTESLRIFPLGGFKCFACDATGSDVIAFWAKYKEVDRAVAIDELMERVAGLEAVSGSSHRNRELDSPPRPPIVPDAKAIPEEMIPVRGAPLALQSPRGTTICVRPTLVHVYRDQSGIAQYVVLRTDLVEGGGKRFCQARWDGEQWWAVGPRAPRMLYGLDQLSATRPDPEWVLVVEGEKAADAARARLPQSVAVVTWPGGANGASFVDWSPIFGRHVVLWPDHDPVGQNAMHTIANRLCDNVGGLEIVDVREMMDKGDAADLPSNIDMLPWILQRTSRWVAMKGDDAAETLELSRTDVGSLQDNESSKGTTIYVNDPIEGEEMRIADLLVEKFASAHPTLFNHHEQTVRILSRDDGPLIECLKSPRMRIYCLDVAYFRSRTKSDGSVPASPPKDFVLTVFERLRESLPILCGVSSVPILRADGSVIQRAGYDDQSGLYYSPPKGFALPPLASEPTPTDVDEARFTLEYVFRDFPFVDDSSRTHVFAGIFTLLLRHLIDGPVPGFVFTAPTPGTGKTKLVEVIGCLLEGVPPPLAELPSDNEELRKLVTSMMLDGSRILAFDNVDRILSGQGLSKLLTARSLKDRLLGTNSTTSGRNNLTVFFTGNNVSTSKEIARRVVVSQLDADHPNPEERSGFQEPDLLGFVRRERPLLLHAVLTIAIAAFRKRVMPDKIPIFGSYEAWRETLGWICGVTGWSGLLDNTRQVRVAADLESGEWAAALELFRTQAGCHEPFQMMSLRKQFEQNGKLSAHSAELPVTLQQALQGKGDFGKRLAKKQRNPFRLPDGSNVVLERFSDGRDGRAEWIIKKREGDV
jgi:putative DNA primase/helicase